MGDDHLLLVESSGYTEQYKRLHFKDIQAVIIRETSRKRDLSVLFAALAFLSATPALIHLDVLDSPFSFMGILFSVLFLTALLVNILRGATCACSVQMPLATHELPSLRRHQHVEILLDRLKPQVERVQGRLSREDMKAGLYRLSLARAHAVQNVNPYGHSEPQQLQDGSCRLHYLAFGCLFLDVVLTWLTLHHNNLPLTILSTITSLFLFILLVTAVVKQRRSRIPGVAKTLVWSALILLVVYSLFCWGYMYGVFILAQRVDVFRDQWTLLSAVSELDPNDHPLLIKAMMGYAATACVIVFSALAALMTSQWPRRDGAGLTLSATNGLQQGR
jgi:hypothetical protein